MFRHYVWTNAIWGFVIFARLFQCWLQSLFVITNNFVCPNQHATGLHRIYITDSEEKPVGIVALKDILALWIRAPKTVAVVHQH